MRSGCGGDHVRSYGDHAQKHRHILRPCPQHTAKGCLTFLEQDTLSQALMPLVNMPKTWYLHLLTITFAQHSTKGCLMFLEKGALSQAFMPFANMPKTLVFTTLLPLAQHIVQQYV